MISNFFQMDFFSIFPIISSGMTIFIFGLFVFIIVQNIRQWNKNNHSPRLTVDATVISKRNAFSPHHHNDHMTTSASYYITFEFESGDRIELPVDASDFGMLAEGDHGRLTFQGSRYLSFERIY